MGRKIAFYHVYCSYQTPTLVYDQLQKLVFSGCYETLDTIYCYLVGPNQSFIQSVNTVIQTFGRKFVIAAVGPEDTTYERFTLLRMLTMIQPDDKVLYFHSKGITKMGHPFVQHWRTFLEYMAFTKHKEALELLDSHDTVGVNYNSLPKPHFSGNFWWATGAYLLKLPKQIDSDYWAPEFWIGSGQPKYFELYSSKINHYHNPYPYREYVDVVISTSGKN